MIEAIEYISQLNSLGTETEAYIMEIKKLYIDLKRRPVGHPSKEEEDDMVILELASELASEQDKGTMAGEKKC